MRIGGGMNVLQGPDMAVIYIRYRFAQKMNASYLILNGSTPNIKLTVLGQKSPVGSLFTPKLT